MQPLSPAVVVQRKHRQVAFAQRYVNFAFLQAGYAQDADWRSLDKLQAMTC